jgi:hypothetical protein
MNMRTSRIFRITIVLALCLVSVVLAQPGADRDTEPLILDLSKFHPEKFVADGKTNPLWQAAAGRQVFDGLPFAIEGRGCV